MGKLDPEEVKKRIARYRLAKQKGVVKPDLGDSEGSAVRDPDANTLDRLGEAAAALGVDLNEGRSPASKKEAYVPKRVRPTLPKDADASMMRRLLKLKSLRDKSGK